MPTLTRVQPLKTRLPLVAHPVPGRLTDWVLATPPASAALLVSAPGYGRTSVVAAAMSGQRSVAWVSLDPFDVRPGRLLDHVEWSVDMATTDAPGPASPPTPDGHPDDIARLDTVLSRWAGRPPFWLVLDDVHLVRDTAAGRALEYITSRLPDAARVVLTSRQELPSLASCHGSTASLRTLSDDELALTDGETSAVLAAMGFGGDDPDLSRLARLCAGWPSALGALSGHGQMSQEQAVAWLRGPGCEHLLSAWWDSLNQQWRDFLIATIKLDRLHPVACDLLRGAEDSAEILYELVAAHAFVRPDPSATPFAWARHPLVTQFVVHRVGAGGPQSRHHRAVAAWSRDQGDVDATVRHLAAAGDVDDALAEVLRHEAAFVETSRAHQVLEWYDLVPMDTLVNQASLLLRQAWTHLLTGNVAAARTAHGSLRSLLAGQEDQSPEIRESRAEQALLAAHLAAWCADPVTALDECRVAADLFGTSWSRNAHMAVRVLEARSLLWLGRTAEARQILESTQRRPGATPLMEQVLLPGLAAGVANAEGRVREAHAAAERAVTTTRAHAAGSPVGSDAALLNRGLALVDLADAAGARRDLDDPAKSSRTAGMVAFDVAALAGRARLDYLFGDPRDALVTLAAARSRLASVNARSPLVHHVNAVEAMVRIRLGDAARAERILRAAPARPSTTLLVVRLAQLRRPGSGLIRLEQLVPTDPRTAVERAVLLASALAEHHVSLAGRWLVEGADIAYENGLLVTLVGAGEPVLEVARAVVRRTGHDGLAELLAVADGAAPAVTTPATHLSSGERELLALLPGRDTNDAIAARLSISVNTVKTRLRRLYAKLGVNNRDDAISVARERGLVS